MEFIKSENEMYQPQPSPPQPTIDPTDERVLSTLLQWVTNTPGASISIYHATDGAWSYSAYKIKEESKNE